MRWLFGILLIVMAHSTQAENPFSDFKGQYVVGGESINKPQEVDEPNTHIRFRIYGEPAEEIYNMIEGAPYENICGEDHLSKKSGNIECDYFSSNKMHVCYFGLDVASNELVRGASC